MLYQVDVGYACYGIVTDDTDKYVVRAPPIAHWMIGVHILGVADWVRKKNGTFVSVVAVENT